MDFLLNIFNIVMNLDQYLNLIVQNYGLLTYLILFGIIFMETGLVVTPFLPGDSLLFTCGVLAASHTLSLSALLPLFILAAILGDSLNYQIGYYLGPKMFERDHRFIKKKHLLRTQEFYDKYGSETIVIARFIPVVRTFAPFVAGIGKMKYWRFLTYNIVGSCIWVVLFVCGGYYFGNLTFIQNNFSMILILIIFISMLPGIAAYFMQAKKDVVLDHQ